MPPARPTPSPITDPLPDERQPTITVLPWRDPLVETHPESHPTATNETLVTGTHAIFGSGECVASEVRP